MTLEDLLARHRPAWMADAACAEHPVAMFFPERGESLVPALEVCRRCLVLAECREWALASGAPEYGILAGMSGKQRTAVRRRLKAEVAAA